MRDMNGKKIKSGDIIYLNYGIPPTIARLRISGVRRLRFECKDGNPRRGYLNSISYLSQDMEVMGSYDQEPWLYDSDEKPVAFGCLFHHTANDKERDR